MNLFIILAQSDVIGTIVGLCVAGIGGTAFLVMGILGRRRRRFEVVGLSGQCVRVPICGGLVNVKVAAGLQPVINPDGALALVPQQVKGIVFHINASMLPHDGEDGDPVRRWLENWAEQNDGTIVERKDRLVAHATKHVEENGREFDLRLWVVGKDNTVVSIVAEIKVRESSPRRTKAILAKAPALIDDMDIKVNRHTMATGTTSTDYTAYETKALIIRSVDSQDQAMLDKWDAKANEILGRYIAARHIEQLTPEVLDWAVLLWQRDQDEQRPSFADLTKALGVAFGNLCVRANEVRWGSTEVDGGRHWVLRHPTTNLVVFPLRVLDPNSSLDDRFSPLFGVIKAYISMKSTAVAA